jgi:hypothetical protein
MTRYPLYRRLGGPQGRSGQVLKISPPSGFDPRIVQLVASRYTGYAIPAQVLFIVCRIFLPSWTPCNTSFPTRLAQLIFSILSRTTFVSWYLKNSFCHFKPVVHPNNVLTCSFYLKNAFCLHCNAQSLESYETLHAGYVGGKVALGHDFIRVLRFPLSVPFHQCSIPILSAITDTIYQGWPVRKLRGPYFKNRLGKNMYFSSEAYGSNTAQRLRDSSHGEPHK